MKKWMILGALCILSFPVFAQTADFVTEMLGTKTASYAQVSYLSAVCQGLVPDTAPETDAFNVLSSRAALPARARADAPVTFEDLAYIMAANWDIRGGLMYRLTKGAPRYVFRQFKTDGILPPDTDPSELVSGTDVLNMYTACRNAYGSEK